MYKHFYAVIIFYFLPHYCIKFISVGPELEAVRLNTLYLYHNSLFCRKELLCVKNGITGWDKGIEISKAVCGGVIGPNPL
jgi:hypothetical protein